MRTRHTIITTSLIACTVILFAGVSFVWSQTAGFIEPGTVTDKLSAPVTTSDAAQTINSRLGIGVSTEDVVPDDVALFVQGSVSTQAGAYNPTGVVVNNASGGKLLNLQNSQVSIGEACPNGARVCVVEKHKARSAVNIVQETGIGLFGETQAAGKSGIYGEGYYGVYAKTDTSQAIPIVGQACTENKGTCIAPFGTAGFFDGDFVVQKELGVLTGDGRNLYRVASLYNKEEDNYSDENGDGIYNAAEVNRATQEADRSDGVAYKSFGALSGDQIVLDPEGQANANALMSDIVASGERVVSIIAVEGDGTDFWVAKDVEVAYESASNQILLKNHAAESRYVRILVSYIK